MIGMICRMDKSGLGQGQTLRLARLLEPEAIMLINSRPFNGSTQYPEWYKGLTKHIHVINGFPTDEQVRHFLEYVDVIISCELFYNNRFTTIAKQSNKKTILVANPEFFDWFNPQWSIFPLPDKVIVPSHWLLEEMKGQFNADYLPTPIFDDEFLRVRQANLRRTGRKYLFIEGKSAVHDRNGLNLLYDALPLSKGDYKLTIKAQQGVKIHPDPRLDYNFDDPENNAELYKGYDLLIHPRRYAGQSLIMCEALSCGIPVIMLNREPENIILPQKWLVPAQISDTFMTRTEVDIYDSNPADLAKKLDKIDLGLEAKLLAYKIGKQYEAESLRPKYEALLS